ncbi:unknown protein [Cronobacter turicensis z3032]|uniref:Uncharacterized protein n=1 Tax=Cronobacter turicensis (strain DSM 18703 / CCUG 55852 / LMG 23827 / z3032) TaxID=693216 RepID=C9XY33_CROTZ|nr:unknown protein [Cronobacter turicensis z3032]
MIAVTSGDGEEKSSVLQAVAENLQSILRYLFLVVFFCHRF